MKISRNRIALNLIIIAFLTVGWAFECPKYTQNQDRYTKFDDITYYKMDLGVFLAGEIALCCVVWGLSLWSPRRNSRTDLVDNKTIPVSTLRTLAQDPDEGVRKYALDRLEQMQQKQIPSSLAEQPGAGPTAATPAEKVPAAVQHAPPLSKDVSQ